MTRHANAAPGRTAQAAIVRTQDHPQRSRFPHARPTHQCPCCGSRIALPWWPRFGDSKHRHDACGFQGRRYDFQRLAAAWAGGAP